MLLFLVIFGIAMIVVFHNFPAIVWLSLWYTLIVTVLFVEERIESRKN